MARQAILILSNYPVTIADYALNPYQFLIGIALGGLSLPLAHAANTPRAG